MADESRELEKIGALWRKKSKKGTDYLSGTINEQRVIVFRVKDKKSDRSPDYVFRSDAPPTNEEGPF